MQWSEAIAGVSALRDEGPRLAAVYGVQYDSRRVEPGDVFVAMRGGTTDGNAHLASALSKGAVAVVTDSPVVFAELHAARPRMPMALVEHGRRALAEISANIFGHPEQKLKISAVTGTNGKTTTAFLLEQMLHGVGRRSVLLGTVTTRVGDALRPSLHTTPESRDLYALFAEGVRANCTEVVMEASSHALAQERVWGLPVDVAIFTNLTQDHLDFHGSMEEYARAKAKLFAGVGAPPPRVAVINNDAEYAGLMAEAYAGDEPVMRYGIGPSPGANHCAENVRLETASIRFDFETPRGSVAIHSPLSGRVNVENLLAAMCAAEARGLTLEEIAAAAESLKAAPGRFEVVAGSREAGVSVVVDYAHTDDALRNLIATARGLVDARGGRVITLFGCGGDRDRTKRPKMGRVACEGSDVVVLTSDNPRSEKPEAILNEITAGMSGAAGEIVVEVDRRAAIEQAIRAAREGDIVLLAGKGHEKMQTFADRTVEFDDVAEAERVLREMIAERNG